jgi:hypothetical protein
MAQTQDRLTSAEIKRWLTLWDAALQVGYELYGFEKPGMVGRVSKLSGFGEPMVPDLCLPPGRQQVQILAWELLSFSAQHFAFLLDSLSSQKYYRLDRSDITIGTNLFTKLRVSRRVAEIGERVGSVERLPQFVLRRAINQIADDILLLHRIWDLYGTDQPSVIQTALNTGNGWARKAWHALHDFLPDVASPLTYIRTNAGIRLIPYGFRPLISFPSSALATGLKRDFLAIPHELGHYLFWRGRDAHGNLFFKRIAELDQFQKASPHLQQWTEEIFADIVGTLIGGPVTVLSLQDMMLEKVGNLFVHDDGHYPPPAIRPYVGLKVCEAMEWQNSCQGLGDRWQGFLATQATSSQFVEKAQSLDTMRSEIENFTAALLGLFTLSDFQPHAWTKDEDYSDDAEIFYTNYSGKSPGVTTTDSSTSTRLPWAGIVAEILYQQDIERETAFAAVGQEWWREVLDLAEGGTTDGDAVGDPLSISLREWFAVLYLGGWGDAGPTGGSPHVT